MEIFPAIDLKDGQCVRLTKGDFDTARIYEADPVLQARRFAESGARWLHIVDLDGARQGAPQQLAIIERIVRETALSVQVGGGIRALETVERLLAAGARRVVIGSLAVQDKATVRAWLKKCGGDRLTLAFDIRMQDGVPEVLTHGWQSGSRQALWDVLDAYADDGLRHVLCTDVEQDGVLQGPNLDLYRDFRARHPALNLIASGGISGMEDLRALAAAGIQEAVVGKAIYEKRIDLTAAVGQVRDAG